MRDAVDRVVGPFLEAADSALGQGYAAVLYGSAARGDFVPGRSDINLLLILDSVAPASCARWGRRSRPGASRRRSRRSLIGRAEWARAADTSPSRSATCGAAPRLLRGDDPLAGLVVDRADLRRAVEREFRGKLLRLRQGYAAAAGDPAALGDLASRSAATIMVLLRALLVLLGRAVPARCRWSSRRPPPGPSGPTGEPWLNVIRHRGESGWRCTTAEFEDYLDAVARATMFVDQLQLGEQR